LTGVLGSRALVACLGLDLVPSLVRGFAPAFASRGAPAALVASRRGSGAVSSAGERFPDTEEVTGSNPVRPTPFFENLSCGGSLDGSQRPAVLVLRCWSEHLTLRPEWEILSGLTSSAEHLSSYRSGHPAAVHVTKRGDLRASHRAESECLTSCGIRAGHAHNAQTADRIIASASVQLGGGHLGVRAGAGSTCRSGGFLTPTMGCHAGEPDEP
jgi:hypothetical protein